METEDVSNATSWSDNPSHAGSEIPNQREPSKARVTMANNITYTLDRDDSYMVVSTAIIDGRKIIVEPVRELGGKRLLIAVGNICTVEAVW